MKEGNLSAEEGVASLYALLELEEGCRYLCEPPSRLPPWRTELWKKEGDLYAPLWDRDSAALLPVATAQMGRGLRTRDSGRFMTHFSLLEVMYLADFWIHGVKPQFTSGCMRIVETDGFWRQNWINIGVAADSIALWLFNPRFPLADREDAFGHTEDDLRYAYEIASDSITTGLGTFTDCRRVTRKKKSTDDETDSENSESFTVWLARGIGPARARMQRPNAEPVEADLSAYSIHREEGYFPLRPGHEWRFDSVSEGKARREIWRAMDDFDSMGIWLNANAYQDRIESGE